MTSDRVVGIIPARGGSKGVIGKNMALVGGRPLVAWTIDAALAAPSLARVIVSTDDPAIAEVARAHGAEAPFLRPAELARDDTASVDTVLHAVEWLASERGDEPDAVMVLQPTSPLRSVADIEAAVARMRKTEAPAVVSVGEVCKQPHWMRFIDERGCLRELMTSREGATRRQARAPVLALNGAIYLIRRDVLLAERTLFPEGTQGLVMPAERSLDLDTPWDLHLAGLLIDRRAAPELPRPAPFGGDRACFLIAEAGVNHNGDPDLAMRMVESAARAGADAVKFQKFQADLLATAAAPKAAYQKDHTDPVESQLEMLRRLELPDTVFAQLKRHAESLGLVFLSSAFDEASVDFLDALGVETFKIPSGEITNLALLDYVAAKGKPVILSTGMASLEEVRRAVSTLVAAGDPPLALLHCVSDYPADPAEANLRAMETLRETFAVPVGFSDHTPGIEVALAATALGASVLEKHFTLDRSLPGPDHAASLEIGELEAMVQGVRAVEEALGHGRKERTVSEQAVARVTRRSLVAARNIREGDVFQEADLVARRPGTGLAPDRVAAVLGRKALRDIRQGEPVTVEMFE